MKKLILGTVVLAISSAVSAGSVIVHPSNSAAIDAGAIKNIFLGKKASFSNGEKAIALDSTAADRDAFNSAVLGKATKKLEAYWSKRIFTGQGTPPKKESPAGIKDIVAKNPGAIGYVDDSLVDGSVKVVHTF